MLTPFSLKSKVHKKLALSVLEKHKEEGRKVMLCVTERDPEKEKEQRERVCHDHYLVVVRLGVMI